MYKVRWKTEQGSRNWGRQTTGYSGYFFEYVIVTFQLSPLFTTVVVV